MVQSTQEHHLKNDKAASEPTASFHSKEEGILCVYYYMICTVDFILRLLDLGLKLIRRGAKEGVDNS